MYAKECYNVCINMAYEYKSVSDSSVDFKRLFLVGPMLLPIYV